MHAPMTRRQWMHDAGIVTAAVLTAPGWTLGAGCAGAVLIVAADNPQASEIARGLRVRQERLIWLSGDPVRFWREQRHSLSGPVAGVTRWSDFLLLRELAYEERLRLRSETRHPSAGGALLVSFVLA